LKAAFKDLGLKPIPKKSAALPGLIADALAAGRKQPPKAQDAAILAAIEPISHYGLAIYTAIDRYLAAAQVQGARRILAPSLQEKRDAIDEMIGMGTEHVVALRKAQPLPRRHKPK
jgi:ferritin-like metal-binding protein YciE